MIPRKTRIPSIEIGDPSRLPQRPEVSVMMLAYNHGDYIRQALDGVLGQIVDFPIEIVIGEDCSSDNTREILLQYQSRYPDVVRVISGENNVGMNLNFLRVAERCRGKYVAICEADDYWSSNKKLSLQHEIAEKRPEVSIIVHNASVENVNGVGHELKYKSFGCDFDVASVFTSAGQFAATASYFMRQEVLLSLPAWIDDAPVIDFFIEAYSQKVGIGHYIADAMSVYRVGQPGSWTSNVLQQNAKAVIFKKKMVNCYDAMLVDFRQHASLIQARSRNAVREILFLSALSGKREYQDAVNSELTKRLSSWESRIAHYGSMTYRQWYRARSAAVRFWSRVGWYRP